MGIAIGLFPKAVPSSLIEDKKVILWSFTLFVWGSCVPSAFLSLTKEHAGPQVGHCSFFRVVIFSLLQLDRYLIKIVVGFYRTYMYYHNQC